MLCVRMHVNFYDMKKCLFIRNDRNEETENATADKYDFKLKC